MTSKTEHGIIPAKTNKRYHIATKLVGNGYEPIPLNNGSKGCFVPGWSSKSVDELMSMFNPRSQGGIGIRNLAAVDIDVVDKEILHDVNRLRIEFMGESDLCRIGRAPRELWVYGGEINTSSSIKIKKDGETAQVELLGKGKQFVAYHTHPDTGLPYTWGSSEPLNTPVASLPLLDSSKVNPFLSAVNELLLEFVDDEGWEIVKPSHSYGEASEPIPADRVFHTPDGSFTAQEVAQGVMGDDPIRCGWAGCTHQYSAGIWHPDGDLTRLYDFGTGCVHYLEGAGPMKDEDMFQVLELMGAALPTTGGTFLGHDVAVHEPSAMTGEEALIYIVGRFAYCSTEDMVWCMTTRSPFTRRNAFRNSYPETVQRMDNNLVTPKMKAVSIVNIWEQTRQMFHSPRFGPDTQELILAGDTGLDVQNHLNTYLAPTLGDASKGSPDGFITHVTRMVPDPRELAAVLDWCAAKLKNPEKRLCGLLMAAPSVFGVGRGMMFEALSQCLGTQYTREVNISKLTSRDGQNNYTDWLDGKLMVHIPEVVATEGADNTVRGHKAAYEVMKEILDPGKTRFELTKKYESTRDVALYTSIFIASNHIQCVAIPEHDRRLLVALNAGRPMTVGESNAMRDWYSNTDNLAALIEWANTWKRTVYMVDHRPPDTAAKKLVADASVPPVTRELLAILDTLPGDAFYAEQVLTQCVYTEKNKDLYTNTLTAICIERFRRPKPENSRYQVLIAPVEREVKKYPWIRTDRVDDKRAKEVSQSAAIMRAEFTRNTAVLGAKSPAQGG